MRNIIKKFDEQLADMVLGTPLDIDINGRRFKIRPQSLMVDGVAKKILDEHNFDAGKLTDYARICTESPSDVCRLIAAYSTEGDEISDAEVIKEKAAYIQANLELRELITVFISVIFFQTTVAKTSLPHVSKNVDMKALDEFCRDTGVSFDTAAKVWSLAKLSIIISWYNLTKGD